MSKTKSLVVGLFFTLNLNVIQMYELIYSIDDIIYNFFNNNKNNNNKDNNNIYIYIYIYIIKIK